MKQENDKKRILYSWESPANGRQTGLRTETYEQPKTTKTQVETENGFMSGSIIDKPEDSSVKSLNHDVQTDFYEQGKNPFDFSGGDWD